MHRSLISLLIFAIFLARVHQIETAFTHPPINTFDSPFHLNNVSSRFHTPIHGILHEHERQQHVAPLFPKHEQGSDASNPIPALFPDSSGVADNDNTRSNLHYLFSDSFPPMIREGIMHNLHVHTAKNPTVQEEIPSPPHPSPPIPLHSSQSVYYDMPPSTGMHHHNAKEAGIRLDAIYDEKRPHRLASSISDIVSEVDISTVASDPSAFTATSAASVTAVVPDPKIFTVASDVDETAFKEVLPVVISVHSGIPVISNDVYVADIKRLYLKVEQRGELVFIYWKTKFVQKFPSSSAYLSIHHSQLPAFELVLFMYDKAVLHRIYATNIKSKGVMAFPLHYGVHLIRILQLGQLFSQRLVLVQ